MAVRFDATADSYSTTTALPTGNVFTCTFWALISVDRNNYSELVSFGDTYTAFATNINGTSVGIFDSVNYNSTPFGETTLTVGAWYQFGIAINGSNVSFSRAAAGQALTVSTASDLASPNPPTILRLGDYFDIGFPWNGRLAGFKLWDAELSQAEVEAELAQYQPVRLSNLLRWHPFINAEAIDYSGHGNTLSGGASATTEDGPPIRWGRLRTSSLIVPTPPPSAVQAPAGVATATAFALAPSTSIAPNPATVTAGATAPTPAVSVGPGADAASATATAHGPGAAVATTAGPATAAATAPDATTLVGTVAHAGPATATAQAGAPSAIVAPTATVATAAAAAHGPATAVASTPAVAAATAVAHDPTGGLSSTVIAGVATATAVAFGVSSTGVGIDCADFTAVVVPDRHQGAAVPDMHATALTRDGHTATVAADVQHATAVVCGRD